MNTESTAQARAKAAAKMPLEEYLRSAGIDTSANFRCFNHTAPAHDDRNPSMTFYADSNTCFCHVCRKHFDIFDAARALKHLSGKALFDHVYAFCGIPVGDTAPPLTAAQPLRAPEASGAFTDKTAYFARCHADIAHTDYFEKRGIHSQELIERFNLGYLTRREKSRWLLLITCKFSRSMRTMSGSPINSAWIKRCWGLNR